VSLHGRPTAVELATAVEEFLRLDVMPELQGRLRFHTLVAANVLAVLARELELGPAQEIAHARRLERLGVRDDAELALAIRTGAMDERLAELLAALTESVDAKLQVANPKYAARTDSPPRTTRQ